MKHYEFVVQPVTDSNTTSSVTNTGQPRDHCEIDGAAYDRKGGVPSHYLVSEEPDGKPVPFRLTKQARKHLDEIQSGHSAGDRNGIAFYSRSSDRLPYGAPAAPKPADEEKKLAKFKSFKDLPENVAPNKGINNMYTPVERHSGSFQRIDYGREGVVSKTGATTMGSSFAHSAKERGGEQLGDVGAGSSSMDPSDSSIIDSI